MQRVLKDKKVTGKKLIKSSASVFSNEDDEMVSHTACSPHHQNSCMESIYGKYQTSQITKSCEPGGIDLGALKVPKGPLTLTSTSGMTAESIQKNTAELIHIQLQKVNRAFVKKKGPRRAEFSESFRQGFPPKNT